MEASDLEEFILGVADVIKKPLIVVDNVFKVLAASSTEGVDDPVWCQAVEQGYYSDELVLQILVQSSTRDVLIDNHDPVERGPLLSRYKRIVSRLIFGGKAYGSLVVLCTDEENQQELLELMPFISDLTVKMSDISPKDVAFSDSVMYELIFTDLIKGNVHTQGVLQSRLAAAGLDKSYKYFRLHTIPLHPSARITAGSLKRTFDQIFIKNWMIYYEDQLLVLVMAKQPLYNFNIPIESVEAVLKPYNLCMCSSDAFTELLNLPYHYNKNRCAISLAEISMDNSTTFSYEQYKFFDMAMTAVGYDETALENYVSEEVQIIREYDRTNGTDYLNTVYNFLLCDKSYVQTAEKLFTHKNTIAYRINRVKELFNISLTDMESVYRILNSCRLIKYMEAIAENKSLRRSSDLSSATMLNIKGYGGDTTT
ncbi:MAG: helix-turn-helix domain-containing protein [Oscillospiraceae bacterium]|nr:helix-turn-helix domain-containing protein [Oscillospiraceae bacterium]